MSLTTGTKVARVAAALVVFLTPAISACGSTASQPTATRPKPAIAAPPPPAHEHAPAALGRVSTKHFLNDGDHEREGDLDNDNSADNDKDPSLHYLPSNYQYHEDSHYHDADDRDTLKYGQAATPQQENAISRIVKRYYYLAVQGDGAQACTMLDSTLARSAAVDYSQYGPSYLHAGRTCATLLALLFKHYHTQLRAGVSVTSIRVSGNTAYAMIGAPKFLPGYITAQQEGNAWKITQLLGNENPLP